MWKIYFTGKLGNPWNSSNRKKWQKWIFMLLNYLIKGIMWSKSHFSESLLGYHSFLKIRINTVRFWRNESILYVKLSIRLFSNVLKWFRWSSQSSQSYSSSCKATHDPYVSRNSKPDHPPGKFCWGRIPTPGAQKSAKPRPLAQKRLC